MGINYIFNVSIIYSRTSSSGVQSTSLYLKLYIEGGEFFFFFILIFTVNAAQVYTITENSRDATFVVRSAVEIMEIIIGVWPLNSPSQLWS